MTRALGRAMPPPRSSRCVVTPAPTGGPTPPTAPSRLRRRVKALHAFIVPFANNGPTVDASTLAVIAGACRDRERLKFQYRDRGGVGTQRTAEPSGLVHTGRRWYLVAWDVAREDWRTFRVDRIQAKVTPGARFAPRDPPDRDLAAYVSRSVSSAPYPVRARIVLYAPLAAMTERMSPTMGTLGAIDAERCELQTGAGSLESLAAWIALLGVEFEVRDPPELIEHLRRLAERLSRAASAGSLSTPTF